MLRGRNWLALAVVVGLLTAIGCESTVPKRAFNDLKKHNATLMDENAELRREFEEFKSEQQAEAVTPAPPIPSIPSTPSVTPAVADLDAIRRQLPAGATVFTRSDQPVIRIDGKLVCHGVNRAGVSTEGKRLLDRLAVILNSDFPGCIVQVEGHTDGDRIKKLARFYKNNWELGYTRAQSVVAYLVSRGVDPKRLRATSSGEHQPVAPNTTRAGKEKNRRVEIVVMPRQDTYALPGPTATSSTMR